MKKTTQLKRLIRSNQLEFLMEAHNGLSAKIVEEQGFKGIWGSGLSISASLGVRDNNEASWTQVLEVVEFMSDCTSIPILLDGDTGYGNFNNMRRLVNKLEQRNVAGVCIEDKIFPKTNSFLRGEAQPIASIEEFCGKIKAGKDVQTDDDFVIVARVEAFIAGWGLKEALTRAEAYRQAGADAILIHSKLAKPDEIFAFLKEWDNHHPVVIVPTKYYSTPTAAFRERKVSMVIWANHLIRGAAKKMQEIASQIYAQEHLIDVEDKIIPVSEIFRLQGDHELKEAEKIYMSKDKEVHSALILAANRGEDLGDLTKDIPKAFIKVGSMSIAERAIIALRNNQIKDITVVVGYKKENVILDNVHIVANEEFETTSELACLDIGLKGNEGSTLVMLGDILFRNYIPGILMRDSADIVLVVDSNPQMLGKRKSDYIRATQKNDPSSYAETDIYLVHASFQCWEEGFDGEWINMMKLSSNGVKLVQDYLVQNAEKARTGMIVDMLRDLAEQGVKIKIHYITGNWIDIDNLLDLNKAGGF
jgi:phosphoenolpyruvate phosphomutase